MTERNICEICVWVRLGPSGSIWDQFGFVRVSLDLSGSVYISLTRTYYILQHHPNHRYPTNSNYEPRPIYSIGYQPQRPVGPPKFNPIQALRPPKFDLFGFLSLEKNDQVYPGDPYTEEPGGLLDPLLSLGMFALISCFFTI